MMLKYLGGRVRARVEAFANANIMSLTLLIVNERAPIGTSP